MSIFSSVISAFCSCSVASSATIIGKSVLITDGNYVGVVEELFFGLQARMSFMRNFKDISIKL